MLPDSKNLRVKIPIIFYHKIGQPPPGVRNRHLYVTPKNFTAQMDYLHRRGYHTATLADVGRALTGQIKLPRRTAVITFDDGHLDNYENAFPVLQRLGFTATIFAVADLVGQTASWPRSRAEEFPEPLLSWEQMRQMRRQGIDFGSHTCTHPKLDRIPPAQARREIFDSRAKLEDGLGSAVESFCYPYGEYNPQVVELVREAGYVAACTTEHGNRHTAADIYTLRRVFIWLDTSVWRFAYYLTSFYDYEKARKRQRKNARKCSHA